MGKWTIGLLAVVLFCIPILLRASSSPGLLADTDTRVLLESIRERQAPLSWFGGDWPLGNHFYRPVATLAFELDNALYGGQPAGYGRTNAILCVLCVLTLFWFLREFTDRLEVAAPAAALFALWHTASTGPLIVAANGVAWVSLALMLLPGRRIVPALVAALCLVFVKWELAGMVPLQFRMIEWLPGRTASVMTLFALLAMAAYARYERQSATRIPGPEPGPLDPPATKGTVLPAPSPRAGWWAAVAAVALALAFGAYEQAVIVPGLMFGVALGMRLQRFRVRWSWQALFWGMLIAYLGLRALVVPSHVSSYQAQQFRSGPGVLDALLGYVLPAWNPLWALLRTLDVGPLIWMTGTPYVALSNIVSNAAIGLAARREWLFLVAGWAMSLVAFLPMAWLKHFDHYHYLPMAMRALLVSAAIGLSIRALITAASRPAIPAPPRLDPAPGSLPRR